MRGQGESAPDSGEQRQGSDEMPEAPGAYVAKDNKPRTGCRAVDRLGNALDGAKLFTHAAAAKAGVVNVPSVFPASRSPKRTTRLTS